jgi:hypothetical protein
MKQRRISVDIRERPRLRGKEIPGLNFIREPCRYAFRRHFRQGLRSHIMEVLRPGDILREQRGVDRDGVTWFPRARPVKMLRIFRSRFSSIDGAREEVRRVNTLTGCLPPETVARSEEFLVDYAISGGREILLCGLQEYVSGEILDPWGLPAVDPHDPAACRLRETATAFVDAVKRMVLDLRLVPDLAGLGNLFIADDGTLKLVDINNISRVVFDNRIRIDDKGYPACDKSMEALLLLERHLINRPVDRRTPPYSPFLHPDRMNRVRSLEDRFREKMGR